MESEKMIIDDVGGLRALLRGNPQFRVELLSSIISVTRDYNLTLSDHVLNNITFADEWELDLRAAPGPTPDGKPDSDKDKDKDKGKRLPSV